MPQLANGTPIFTTPEEDFLLMLRFFAKCRSEDAKLGAGEPDQNMAHFVDPVREQGVITKIDLPCRQLTGHLNLTGTPRNLVSLNLANNGLSGRLDLSALPFTLRELNLTNNRFTGEVDLTSLPSCSERVYLSQNAFTGEINLRQLPPKLRHLELQINKFTHVTTEVLPMSPNVKDPAGEADRSPSFDDVPTTDADGGVATSATAADDEADSNVQKEVPMVTTTPPRPTSAEVTAAEDGKGAVDEAAPGALDAPDDGSRASWTVPNEPYEPEPPSIVLGGGMKIVPPPNLALLPPALESLKMQRNPLVNMPKPTGKEKGGPKKNATVWW